MTYVLATSESSISEEVEVSWRGENGNYLQIKQIILLRLGFFGWFGCFFFEHVDFVASAPISIRSFMTL